MTMLDDFYDLLDELHQRLGGTRVLADCDGRQDWPQRGVYFFFEPGEVRADGRPRVVRVGTHALTSGSSTTLWKRLSQHRGHLGGSHAGGGNHRGSIFRHHVGTALFARDGDPLGLATSWSDRKQRNNAEHPHEVKVSHHIGSMPFLWLAVDDPPGPSSDRGVIERGAIALLSAPSSRAADQPSPGWLGRFSDRPAITSSGLWNVNHVGDRIDTTFMDSLERNISGNG